MAKNLNDEVVAATCTKDNLYLDSDKAKPLKDDIVKQLDIVITKFNALNKATKTLVDKKYVRGDIRKTLNNAGKKIGKQATYATNKKKEIVSSYEADVKDYTIKMLSDRLTALEQKIAQMSNE